MTKRKRVFLKFIAGAGICLALFVCIRLWLGPSGAGITPENFNKIQKGMTLTEVESILGVAPGDFSGTDEQLRQIWIDMTIKGMAKRVGTAPSHVWLGPEASIGIWMDEGELVVEKMCYEHAYQGGRFLRKLKRWLGL